MKYRSRFDGKRHSSVEQSILYSKCRLRQQYLLTLDRLIGVCIHYFFSLARLPYCNTHPTNILNSLVTVYHPPIIMVMVATAMTAVDNAPMMDPLVGSSTSYSSQSLAVTVEVMAPIV